MVQINKMTSLQSLFAPSFWVTTVRTLNHLFVKIYIGQYQIIIWKG